MGKQKKSFQKGVCWLRRDIRLHDHHALSEACAQCDEIEVIFIFDPLILNKIVNYAKKVAPQGFDESGNLSDQRIEFLLEGLSNLQRKLEEYGGTLLVRYGDPKEVLAQVFEQTQAEALFFNRDYEPYAKERDQRVTEALQQKGISVFDYKDHVIYEEKEIVKPDGDPYKVFTPYKKRWLETFHEQWEGGQLPTYQCRGLKDRIAKISNNEQSHERIHKGKFRKKMGFASFPLDIKVSGKSATAKLNSFSKQKLSLYEANRDFPAAHGTSELSPFIRHGLISIRQMVNAALKEKDQGHQSWLNELIWRDFYQMILALFPQVQKQAFKSDFQHIEWRGKSKNFKLWAIGQTGFPLIDAAMRCLNQTGLMPNRLRMLTASFLCKTLLLNWQWGEQYFALKLLDYDLAANNGGWQWAASTGCDAQPYFRIFNPYTQSEKFDPNGQFIREFCPELSGFSNKTIHNPQKASKEEQAKANCEIGKDYPSPIVDYKSQRDEAMQMYKEAKS